MSIALNVKSILNRHWHENLGRRKENMDTRTEFEMTEEDLKVILDACKATPYLLIGGNYSPTPQENANRVWQNLGVKMGFDYMTVKPITGKGERFFTAVKGKGDLS